MSKKWLLVLVIIAVVGILGFKLFGNNQKSLVNPAVLSPSSSPSVTPSPPQTPKTFKFDGSTDLKKELDTVNPQVLDSDFE